MTEEPLFRANDWEDRLRTYLDRVREEPFKWGTHDCGLFAADAIKAQTGVDLAADLRGSYTDKKGAAQALRDHGAGTLVKTVMAWLGEPKSVHFAKRGDIMMKDAWTLGVCVGRYSWFIADEDDFKGLAIVPTFDCENAFTVPFVEPSNG